MKISHIKSTLRTLTDLCVIKHSVKVKRAFVDIVFNNSVVK